MGPHELRSNLIPPKQVLRDHLSSRWTCLADFPGGSHLCGMSSPKRSQEIFPPRQFASKSFPAHFALRREGKFTPTGFVAKWVSIKGSWFESQTRFTTFRAFGLNPNVQFKSNDDSNSHRPQGDDLNPKGPWDSNPLHPFGAARYCSQNTIDWTPKLLISTRFSSRGPEKTLPRKGGNSQGLRPTLR